MFGFLKKRRINQYIEGASSYIEQKFIPRDNSDSTKTKKETIKPRGEIEYSLRSDPVDDSYSATEVSHIMKGCADDKRRVLSVLDDNLNQSFVERLIYYIDKKGFRDSAVYKAAHVDKRLFSKMMSDRNYRPAKDTAIAIAFGLKLSPEETNDLLSRAGYTFSHSDKRDVVLEYFFREGIYNLMDINDVLYHLDLKILGRTS